MFRRHKITVIGAGATGATTAHIAALKELGDVVLLDVAEGIPQGKALDIYESGPVEGFGVRVTGSNDYADTRDSDLVVITAGLPRKPGMSRDDLLKVNAGIVRDVAAEAAKQSPDAVVMVLTNPADVMTYVAWKASGFPPARVLGQAGVLDSSRFRTFLADALDLSPQDVSAFVLGGHGDSMVPLTRYSYAGGIPVEKLLSADQLAAIVERTRQGGGEIVNLMKLSAFYAPGSSLVAMMKAILHNERRVLPVIAYLDGEYGERDIYVGVPAVLGGHGVERVLEVDLTDAEREAVRASFGSVRQLLDLIRPAD